VAEQPIFRLEKPIKKEMEAYIDTHFPLHVAPVLQDEQEPEPQDEQEEETTAEAPRG
jgi:hypothetical protein